MNYSIIYSSQTGNTALLAEKLKTILPGEDCLYFGPPQPAPVQATKANRLYVGFWTDKGTCDAGTAAFLAQLRDKEIFLFGTAGFGGQKEYFDRILENIKKQLHSSNTVTGSFMCQGRMPVSVRQRYESMLNTAPEKFQPMIDNFDRALSHPDQADLSLLEKAVLS